MDMQTLSTKMEDRISAPETNTETVVLVRPKIQDGIVIFNPLKAEDWHPDDLAHPLST